MPTSRVTGDCVCINHVIVTLERQTEIIIFLVLLFPGKVITFPKGKTSHCSGQQYKEDNVMPMAVPLYGNLSRAALLTTGWRALKGRYLSGCAHKDQTCFQGVSFF